MVKNGTKFEYQYAIKDHLDNTRVLFKDDGTGIAIVEQESHYYPFGLQLAGLGSTGGSPENKFLYNGIPTKAETSLFLNRDEIFPDFKEPADAHGAVLGSSFSKTSA